MEKLQLYMILLGCKPKGRHTEQHDLFFTIGSDLKSTIPEIKNFWHDGGTIHIDSWRTITECDGYEISVAKQSKKTTPSKNDLKLFFLNLGGYKPGDLEEYHYKMVVVALNKTEAIKQAKASAFYMHTGFKGAASHIDDKYGIDVDDFYEIEDILPAEQKLKYKLKITKKSKIEKDVLHIGYTNLSKIK
jgi:hypothetical protein